MEDEGKLYPQNEGKLEAKNDKSETHRQLRENIVWHLSGSCLDKHCGPLIKATEI